LVDKEGFFTQTKKTSYERRGRGRDNTNEKSSNGTSTRKTSKKEEKDLEEKDSHHHYAKSTRGRYKDHHVARHGFHKDTKKGRFKRFNRKKKKLKKKTEEKSEEKVEEKIEEKVEEKVEEKKEEKKEVVEEFFSLEDFKKQKKRKRVKSFITT